MRGQPTSPALRRLLESPALALLARVGLTCAYWWGGLAKLGDFAAARAEMAHFFGDANPGLLAAATIAVELAGSALVICNRLPWLGAGALAVFTAMATLVAHDFWNASDPSVHFREFNSFLEHIGLIGGLVLAGIFPAPRSQGEP